MIKVDLNFGIAGWYKIEKGKVLPDGREVREVVADWFPNLITNQGLDRLGGNSDAFNFCQVGSGDNTPAFTDTALETWVAGSSTTQSTNITVQGSSPYYASNTVVKRFAAGVATGNLSEVGMGWAASGGTLFSRALILDGGGTPTTITVLADEFLDVTYQYRVYPPTVDVTGTVNISGIDYDYTIRAAKVTTLQAGFASGWVATSLAAGFQATNFGWRTYTGTIGAITGEPTGLMSPSNPTTVSNASYSTNNLYRDGTITWGLDTANGNIRSILVPLQWGVYQIEFDPVLAKTSSMQLQLLFRQSWSRATI